MSERNSLLESIADTIKDYRKGELDRPTPDHVDKWAKQFDGTVQVPLLRELDHVLKQTYLDKDFFVGFLSKLVVNEKLAGADPCAFWRIANFLQIQSNGHSQEDILEIFGDSLEEKCGVEVDDCGGSSGVYIYLDDAMFSGNRVGNDLTSWIESSAPAQGVVHVLVVALHTGGQWLVDKKLKKVISDSGKNIKIQYWRSLEVENRKYYKNKAEVLWPSAVPEDADVKAYLGKNHKFPFEPRTVGGSLGPFSSEEGRQLLEREMLIAGVKIRNLCASPKDIMRPLGFSPFGVGFGSTIITFRNCPNNCPLALWWGDPKASSSNPLSKWYPLFPRKTYAQEVDFGEIVF